MAYRFPAMGGLQLVHNGRTIGVFAVDTGVVGIQVMLAELVNNEWIGRWTSTPTMEDALRREIDGMGGVVNWLKSLIDKIVAALAQLFGIAPPQPKTLVDEINLALQQGFSLTSGPNGPVFGAK